MSTVIPFDYYGAALLAIEQSMLIGREPPALPPLSLFVLKNGRPIFDINDPCPRCSGWMFVIDKVQGDTIQVTQCWVCRGTGYVELGGEG